ncbi:hypothetical protein [Vibrio sp. Vb1980]|nr:hypothetical protein [Vibrio sp. Vb1980]MDW1977421.1 hypothetical protein [Vibrio sp. Vb1980]
MESQADIKKGFQAKIKKHAGSLDLYTLPSGKDLYSGQCCQENGDFNFETNMNKYGKGIWLTEDIYSAKSYCYSRVVPETKQQKVFKVNVKNSVTFLRCPLEINPGMMFGKQIGTMMQDEYLSLNWLIFIEALKEYDIKYSGIQGHIRVDPSLDYVNEIWTPNSNLLNQIDSRLVPKKYQDFISKYGSTREEVNVNLFQ